MSINYRDTVKLPQTDFAMRAGLPVKEPEMLKHWQDINLYAQIMEARKGSEQFMLHDGPPYANGDLHIGHALNKILKDFVIRSQSMAGRYAPYVPGWDCHGLPIEWKIEEKYRKKKKNKDEVPINVFRNECREFAAQWIDIQREQFARLGVLGDWQNPYKTMDFKAEAIIAQEIGKFLLNGTLYLGSKPVMWSVVEKTALAEAEVEYDEEHVSDSIYVGFEIASSTDDALQGAKALIWTTTPWTIPANRAIAYNPAINYGLYEVAVVAEGSLAKQGMHVVIATELAEDFAGKAKITELKHIKTVSLEGAIAKHPWHDQGYDYDVPLLAVDYAEATTGTGLVHTAPNHGEDDWATGMKYGLSMAETVKADGVYADRLPLVAGMHVYKVAPFVLEKLTEADALMYHGKLTHSYPLSWRSKAPLIYRNTPQWFIALDDERNIRQTALDALKNVEFFPKVGRNRITSMVEQRPDWCVSRQRAWGVPIAIFVHKETGQPLRDADVMARVVKAFEQHGADIWYEDNAQDFLGEKYSTEEYEKVMDILDVWFDSGSTHAFVLEDRVELSSPANLYLEGSDQHRGWFQSSLLESCGTRGRAPYEQVLTHGFILDGKGFKMSKSLGNIVAPQQVADQYGVDILRLWVANSDYSGDLRIGDDILKGISDIYRRLRNTIRWLLGNLDGFDGSDMVDYKDMPELEQYILHRLNDLHESLHHDALENYAYHKFFTGLHNFCTIDLSSIYFDIRKDTLYCAGDKSLERRAALTVLHILFDALSTWLAPFIPFTTEEAWKTRYPNAKSIHLELFKATEKSWKNDALASKWEKLLKIRQVVTGAIELERKEKRIGSSLEAAPVLYVSAQNAQLLEMPNLADFFITSHAEISLDAAPEGAFKLADVADIAVVVKIAEGEKCERCWKVGEIVPQNEHTTICPRCVEALS